MILPLKNTGMKLSFIHEIERYQQIDENRATRFLQGLAVAGAGFAASGANNHAAAAEPIPMKATATSSASSTIPDLPNIKYKNQLTINSKQKEPIVDTYQQLNNMVQDLYHDVAVSDFGKNGGKVDAEIWGVTPDGKEIRLFKPNLHKVMTTKPNNGSMWSTNVTLKVTFKDGSGRTVDAKTAFPQKEVKGPNEYVSDPK